jgi:hypothetical protein
MTFAICSCGWVGVATESVQLPHAFSVGHKVRFRSFNQPHMSSDGVERLLAEARWGKS